MVHEHGRHGEGGPRARWPTGARRFVPDEWATVYRQWLENIQDWCVSRQLWWGHQIPAWYAADGTPFVGRTFEEAQRARRRPRARRSRPTARDPDVLDTWFSSALVPFSTLGWPDEKQFARERKFYLPSSVLITGFDIIFFWVARMIMTTLHFTGEIAVPRRVHQRHRARRRGPEDVEVEGQHASTRST